MLTLGMFLFVFGVFAGCVWWACTSDADGESEKTAADNALE
jgi:hypothetical protein